MKTTNKKNTNNYETFELLFTDKKREDFNSDEEYEEYKKLKKIEIEEIVKAMLPMEGDKERFTMIDIYPDFYSSIDKTI